MFNDTRAQNIISAIGCALKIDMVITQCKELCKINITVLLIKIYNKTQNLLEMIKTSVGWNLNDSTMTMYNI